MTCFYLIRKRMLFNIPTASCGVNKKRYSRKSGELPSWELDKIGFQEIFHRRNPRMNEPQENYLKKVFERKNRNSKNFHYVIIFFFACSVDSYWRNCQIQWFLLCWKRLWSCFWQFFLLFNPWGTTEMKTKLEPFMCDLNNNLNISYNEIAEV